MAEEELDSSSIASGTMVPEGHLPMYLADAFGELYEEDGLILMGKGLGCLLLLATFVRFYADTEEGHAALIQEEEEEQRRAAASASAPSKATTRKPPLVIVLSLNDSERQSLLHILTSWGTPPELLPTMITNEAGQSKDRQALYARGGVFCITSRILITDLLTNVVTANEIDGMLVFRADQVVEESTEAFILRIFHSQKQPQCSGFVKGFSESAESLQSGFAKVDKVLKALRVRRLYLYPRFQESVRQELEEHPPLVTELYQPLSPLQQEIQNCIAAAVQACVRELKQSTNKLEWNDSDLSMKNCVTTHFDRAISRQLDKEWHKLQPSTKQLVQDLRTLRTLFQALLHYDCVSFWRLLNSIKTMSAASRNPSMWLLTPAGERLFRKAKERVYKIERLSANSKPADATTSTSTTAHSRLVPVLEENPKWKLLRKVLFEIRQEHDKKMQQKKSDEDNDDDEGPCSILVMVKDDRTLETVKTYLTGGKQKTLPFNWLRFLENQNDRSRSITSGPEGMAALSEERRLLLEEEGRTRRILFGEGARRRGGGKGQAKGSSKSKSTKRRLNEVPAYLKKRRRVATEKGRGAHQTKEDLERAAVLDDAVEEMEHELNNNSAEEGAMNDGKEHDSDDDDQSQYNRVAARLEKGKQLDEEFTQAMFRVTHPSQELRVVLKSYGAVEGDYTQLLQDIRPRYVVFHDMEDVAFIRAVEIYASLNHNNNNPTDSSQAKDRVKAFFLMFEQSAEEKIFQQALKREKEAFTKLIEHKMTMPPPMLHDNTVTQEMQQAHGSSASTYMDGTLPLAFDSRRGQGKANDSKRRRDIAVDVREFRAALPSILHQGGMRLAPVTLTVGDFVLSNVHCVERKSISDLFGSFASGRLYTQAEAMCKHYKAPCLLIEFDPNKSFCLQNPNEMGLDIRNDSACTKLSLLSMHFPLLRILWSKSPHETLKIFQDLKKNHSEVDVDHAVEVGRNESLETLFQGPNVSTAKNDDEEEEEEDEVNDVARDMLLRIPGVTVQAARRIMEQVDSLQELAKLPREELRNIAGPVAGQKIFTFFRQLQQQQQQQS